MTNINRYQWNEIRLYLMKKRKSYIIEMLVDFMTDDQALPILKEINEYKNMKEVREVDFDKIRKHLRKEYKEDVVNIIVNDMSHGSALALLDNIKLLNGEKP